MTVRNAWFLLLVIGQLLVSACAREAAVFNIPLNQAYERLCRLDMGEDVRSGVFRYSEPTLPFTSLPNESVSWRMRNGIDVVAHLSDAGDNRTRVDVDVTLPPDVQARIPTRFHAMMKDMLRERIASYLEDRPFDDRQFIDAMNRGILDLMP